MKTLIHKTPGMFLVAYLIGLCSIGKPFAYIGFGEKIFVSEIALVFLFIFLFQRRRNLKQLFDQGPTHRLLAWIWVAFLTWGYTGVAKALFEANFPVIDIFKQSVLITYSTWILYLLVLQPKEKAKLFLGILIGVCLIQLGNWKQVLDALIHNPKKIEFRIQQWAMIGNEAISPLFPFIGLFTARRWLLRLQGLYGITFVSQILFYFKRNWLLSYVLSILTLARINIRSVKKHFTYVFVGAAISFMLFIGVAHRQGISVFELYRIIESDFSSRFTHGEFDTNQKGPGSMMAWRWHLWTEAMKEWKESPIVGVGFGDPIVKTTQFGPVFIDGKRISGPHNSYITVLYRTGLIGFSLFMALLLIPYWQGVLKIIKQRVSHDSPHLIAVCCSTTLLLFCLFNVCLENPQGAIPFWLGLGGLMSLTRLTSYSKETLK